MLKKLREQVCAANRALAKHGLVPLTWGNASGIDRKRGIVVIKPSGVAYESLTPQSLVAVDMKGRVVEGHLNPSSDMPTHLELYRAFPRIGGIVHAHSAYATMFAQAGRELPCFGTTHADHFHGAVPVTRPMTRTEVEHAYEANTGKVIVERLRGMDEMAVPAVLVANHGAVAWGTDVAEAVVNAVALEAVAKMAAGTILINPRARPAPRCLLDKHYSRKHGRAAYYGQKKPANKRSRG